MKRIYLIGFIVLCAASNAFAYDLQEGGKDWGSWVVCSSDEECVVIHDACGGWTAVNMGFKAQGEEYQSELGAVSSCAYVKMEPEPKALCVDQMCTLQPTHSDMK
jgi:hypothetical protein